MLSQVSLLNRPSRLSKTADVNVGATHSIFDGLIDEVRISMFATMLIMRPQKLRLLLMITPCIFYTLMKTISMAIASIISAK